MRVSILAAIGVGLCLSAWQAPPVRADAEGPETTVVATVGAHKVTVAELNQRIAAIPLFQLRTFGRSDDEIRRNFLTRVVVRDALLAEGAGDKKLTERDDVKERIRAELRNAMLEKLRKDALRDRPVTDEEIKQYYDANPAKFHAPLRIAISRILVGTKAEAEAVIKEYLADPTGKKWLDLARDKSLDKATAMRGGNLGFVGPDGTTDEAGLKLDRAVIAAAASVADGKLVPEPVAEGERFAVLFRRQSMQPIDRPLALEVSSIRQMLTHERAEKALNAKIAELRAEHLSELNADLVDLVDVTPMGDVHSVRRPGALPRVKPLAPPAPIQRPGGALR